MQWELIVVDNNCTDDTADVVRAYSTDPRIPLLRRVLEKRQGIAHARRRAFSESRGALLVCADDDCVLAPNWIEQAVRFMREHPRAGYVGGRNIIVWEQTPDHVADLYGESLARQDLGDRTIQMPATGRRCLVGAGFAARRDAIVSSQWLERGVLVGRCRERLGAGEDAEIFFRIRNAGWECWYTPELVLSHMIPSSRTTLHYLQRLHRGFGEAEAFLLALSRVPFPTWRDRLTSARWSFWQLINVIASWRFSRQQPNERPKWLIQKSYATGCVSGALRYLLTGRA
jgi:cellulose synthase/poly-beta-1,6-N-acetylglucosamine synthase-like glycosyltransferase